ncbi:MAG: helix-turn-helix transcriptional regulator [Ktedonobacteraceae bacterium]|nr:helix-turn-helix transcriptional regulator [Ktedonobacteraceae bacterium]
MSDTDAAQVEPIHQGRIVALDRQAANLSQQDLADFMGVSWYTVQRMEKQPVIKDVQRRQFLVAFLGIPAAYLQLDTDTQEQWAERAELLYNDDPMSFVEDLVNTRWTMLLIGGPRHAAGGLDRLVQEVEFFAQTVRERAWRRRAHTQLCMTYLLRGSVVGELLHNQQSLAWYQKAHTVAWELNDAELMAAVRVSEGIAFLRKEQPREAIEYYQHALDLVTGKGLPLLRGNILSVLSEAHAKAGQGQQCWRNLELAEHILEQTAKARECSYRVFNAELLNGYKGTNALLLRDYDRALRLLDKSLKSYDQTRVLEKARLIVRKADAYYGQGNVDYCTDTAKEAFTLASTVEAKTTLVRVKGLHTRLLRGAWARERGTVELGMMIADYERKYRPLTSDDSPSVPQ